MDAYGCSWPRQSFLGWMKCEYDPGAFMCKLKQTTEEKRREEILVSPLKVNKIAEQKKYESCTAVASTSGPRDCYF